MSEKSEPREINPPVQLHGSRRDEDGNRAPVKFFGPKGATAPKPAKRQARSTGKKAAKTSSAQSAPPAEESSPRATVRPAPTPTQIPESDSSK